MTFTAGTRLGPYEILSALGAGGMGEVYKARDTRLDRTVAVKILPEALAADPQFRERFDREARAISQLTHLHICTLYDVGEQDGTAFLVMELLDGETLADRLKKGALPLDEALKVAIEIASALAAAHRHGVVHRDLKPGNIMLAKTGAKLLDFGLAKATGPVIAGGGLSMLPTTPPNLTAHGTILGTFQYMAPEQLEGQEADARTDIFAFGAVVYEMLTGKKAFEGKSQASLIGAIMHAEPPPVSTMQSLTPALLDRVVSKCLAKDAGERWQSAKDLHDELLWVAGNGSSSPATATAPVAVRRTSRKRLAWMMAGVFLGAAIAALALGAFGYLHRAPEDTGAVRFFVPPPEAWNWPQNSRAAVAPLAVSPDGRRVAFVATSADGRSLLWVRALDMLTAQALAGTDDASSPFWSPDNRFLGFFAAGKLKKIAVSGGPAMTLCDALTNGGGTWSRDGVIVFSSGPAALQKVSAAGGMPTVATVPGQGETGHIRPFFLPDGRHFLYRAYSSSATAGPLYLASLDSAERTLLLNADSTNVLYTQDYVLFLRDTTLMAQRFDARRLVLTGEASPIAEQIRTAGGGGGAGVFSASENGVLAYQTGTAVGAFQLAWVGREGKPAGVLGDRGDYADLALSPDETRATVSLLVPTRRTRDIWLFDVSRNLRTRFTFDPAADALSSVWSPDASRVVFASRRKGHSDLYQKASNGAGTEDLVFADDRDKFPVSWSPDGRFILYVVSGGATGNDLWVFPLFGDRKPFPFLQSPYSEAPGQFSPDGRWVVYASDESGKGEVYVAPFPGPGGKWLISTAGGSMPRWRHDGTEIFYLAPDQTLMAATVNGKGGSFAVGLVKPLFKPRVVLGRSPYDVTRDGQRFLINVTPEQATAAPITVVLNWQAAVKK